MIFCAICYLLYNLKNVKNTQGGVVFLVQLQASACNITKTITPPWVFFAFFKLHKWYQIAQSIVYVFHSLFLMVALAVMENRVIAIAT